MSTVIKIDDKPVVIKGGAYMLSRLEQTSGVTVEGISGVAGFSAIPVEVFKSLVESGEADKDTLVTALATVLSGMQEKYTKGALIKKISDWDNETLAKTAKDVYLELKASPKDTVRIEL